MNTSQQYVEPAAFSVHFSTRQSADRAELEQFIQDNFWQAYQARIDHFMPHLMSVRDAEGRLVAVCGLRNAANEALFLERYLDTSIEARLSARMGYTICRSEIVEVGNFAVAEAGAARYLINEIIQQLYLTSKQWAVFTIVPLISNAFVKMGIQAELLGAAKKECIPPEEQANWGCYYAQKPQIMAVQRV